MISTMENGGGLIEARLTNHKGQLCLYRPILCQEGYCNECQIYICAHCKWSLADTCKSCELKDKYNRWQDTNNEPITERE